MKSKESKAMLEVWEWKEAIYNEVKQLPLHEQINTIFQMASEETEKTKKSGNLLFNKLVMDTERFSLYSSTNGFIPASELSINLGKGLIFFIIDGIHGILILFFSNNLQNSHKEITDNNKIFLSSFLLITKFTF